MPEKLTKHSLNLFEGDYAKVRELYPQYGGGAVIRSVVRKFILKVEARREAGLPDIDINTDVKV